MGDFLRDLRDDRETREDLDIYDNDRGCNTATNDPYERPHVVILVHGIRTRAPWMDPVAEMLESDPSIRVVKPKYGRFDLIRFVLPTELFARAAIRRIENTIRREQERGSKQISVIAHSFGTYIISRLLMRDHFLRLHRLILCGSIMKRHFDWIEFQHKVGPDKCKAYYIVNEYSSHDQWPLIANYLTYVYGDAGTHGFDDPSYVFNRRHECGHSAYLDADFAKKYWLPFLTDGILAR